jgi:TRAP-type mannitol/chloroaromatic compound transport system permease small subunit
MIKKPAATGIAAVDAIDSFVFAVGHIVCWANGVLIGVIIIQVILRYFFSAGLVWLEELQWHLYALSVMFGISYAQSKDSHIRVDVIAMRLSPTAIRRWEVFGIVFFLLPFIYVVFSHSLDFVAESWRLNERSDAPLGLPWRWAIKAVIPASFALLALATLGRLIRDVLLLARKAP